MAIDSGLKKADGGDLGNNLFAGNGSSSGNQTFSIIMKNGVDLGKGWYNKSECYATYGNVGFKNSAGTDVGTLLGKYGTLNCTCDVDVDTCTYDTDTDGCFVKGMVITDRGQIEVSEIHVGDNIWGVDEEWHTVIGVAKNTVGTRKVYGLKNGGQVTSEHVVYVGDCAYVADMESLKASIGAPIEADNGVVGIYNVPSCILEIDGATLFVVSGDTPTYSPICEKSFVGYLNGERVLFAGRV